jgi:hypothetical protein
MKTITLISEIISEHQKSFNQNENKKKLFLGWSKSVFGPKTLFFFENVENIRRLSTIGHQIIFEKKNHFRSNTYVQKFAYIIQLTLTTCTQQNAKHYILHPIRCLMHHFYGHVLDKLP